MGRRFTYVAIGVLAAFLNSCSESAGTARHLDQLTIQANDLTMDIGQTQTLKVIGNYSDKTSEDVSDNKSLNWKSLHVNTLRVSKGKVTALAAGTAIVTVSIGSVTTKITFTVNDPGLESLSITPSNSAIANGESQQFTAMGHYDDGSTKDLTDNVTWDSSSPAIVTISNSPGSHGLATADSLGDSTITATLGSITDSTLVTVTDAVVVSISVSPSSASIANGTQQSFTALGTYSDASTHDVTSEVTWESSDENIVTISNLAGSEGVASALMDGAVTITATYEDAIADTASLTVTSATLISIDVTPINPSVAKGLQQQFVATGTYSDASTQDISSIVAWSSFDTNVATIDADGLATGVDVGSSVITATSGLVSGNTTLTVDPATLVSIAISPSAPSIRNGTLQQFTALGIYTDASTQDITASVVWSSSDTNIATIDANGLASSVSSGSTTITATLGMISDTADLTVLPATLTSIDVTPALPSIANGTSMYFVATGTFSDASTQDLTDQVIWDSSDTNIATISNAADSKGKAISVSVGPTTITATLGLVSGNTTLTITPATLVSIDITPLNPTIAKGEQQQFVATGTFSDASTQDISEDVVWSSFDTNVATIDAVGLATGVDEGSSTMTATLGMISNNTTLTVGPAELVSIAISPSDVTNGVGSTRQFTATGTYTDDSTQDLSSTVTWASSDTDVATIDSNGLATTLSEGTTTITATLGLISDSTTLTVEVALDHVTITPTTSTLKKNKSRKLIGWAHYTDGSVVDMTNNLNRWTSSNNTIIRVNQGNKPGKIKALTNSGTATITFTYTEDGITKSATLDVTAIP